MNKENSGTEMGFDSLVSALAAEALAAMGIVDHPAFKGIKKDLKHAQAVIDTLSMLKGKTAGNLSVKESDLLEEALHQLRLGYVASLKNDGLTGEKGQGTGGVS